MSEIILKDGNGEKYSLSQYEDDKETLFICCSSVDSCGGAYIPLSQKEAEQLVEHLQVFVKKGIL